MYETKRNSKGTSAASRASDSSAENLHKNMVFYDPDFFQLLLLCRTLTALFFIDSSFSAISQIIPTQLEQVSSD